MEGANHKKSKVSHKKPYNHPSITIFIFSCKSLGKTFLIKIHFSLAAIIICQNSLIWHISQSKRNKSSEIFEGILTVFFGSLFATIPKLLNIIMITMIFGIIYH